MAAAAKGPSQATYRRPWMYEKQSAAFFNECRYSVIEGSTKCGKTIGCMSWLLEQAILCKVPGRNFWWVAPVFNQAKIAFNRIKRGIPRALYKANATELTITLVNGAVLSFKGADKPDSLYGEDVYAAVIDEASRVKEDAWHAVRSTLTATNGPLRIIGNVKGKANWFYKIALRAKQGMEGWQYHKITAYDAVAAGVLKLAEIEDAKAALPEAVFRELYLAEPADDGGNPFGISHIEAAIRPLSTKRPVAWGADLAKSVDWTVVTGLDEDGAVCRWERWRSSWLETVPRIRQLVGRDPCLVDATGVGDPVLEMIRDTDTWDNFEGYVFGAKSKQMLMEGLAVSIQQKQIGYPEGVIVSELEAFEYAYTRTGVTYTAPEGFHDDAVCSLALANECRRRLGPIYTPTAPISTDRDSPWNPTNH